MPSGDIGSVPVIPPNGLGNKTAIGGPSTRTISLSDCCLKACSLEKENSGGGSEDDCGSGGGAEGGCGSRGRGEGDCESGGGAEDGGELNEEGFGFR